MHQIRYEKNRPGHVQYNFYGTEDLKTVINLVHL